MHSLFFLALTAVIFFHNNSYGMLPAMGEWITDYRAKKNDFLKNKPVNREKITDTIFLQNITPESYVLKGELLNIIGHLSEEQLVCYQNKANELMDVPGTRIFFSDEPVWYGEEKLLEIRDEDDKLHAINNHDLFLFFNDSLNPSIYTPLIPQELVKKDRDTIITFALALKEKKICIPSSIFIPLICFNTHKYLIDTFKCMEGKAAQLSKDPEEYIMDFDQNDNNSCSHYLMNAQRIFTSKAEQLMNNFNITMVQKIIGHYFVKKDSK